jgi:hypothetical protein
MILETTDDRQVLRQVQPTAKDATLYTLETWYVSGTQLLIPCRKIIIHNNNNNNNNNKGRKCHHMTCLSGTDGRQWFGPNPLATSVLEGVGGEHHAPD